MGQAVMLHEFVIRPMTPDDIPEVSRWVAAVPLWQRYQVRALHLVAQFAAALERGHILLAADRGAQDVSCGFVWCAPQGAVWPQRVPPAAGREARA
ncbi:MAG: hypothetical protein M5R40_28395 [Anaerolineae bacterium]|nr:hypothetical protein [Anaerolineae bacterium]